MVAVDRLARPAGIRIDYRVAADGNNVDGMRGDVVRRRRQEVKGHRLHIAVEAADRRKIEFVSRGMEIEIVSCAAGVEPRCL
jgi:hypothetical protein